jgi:hypothetical protein
MLIAKHKIMSKNEFEAAYNALTLETSDNRTLQSKFSNLLNITEKPKSCPAVAPHT